MKIPPLNFANINLKVKAAKSGDRNKRKKGLEER
jgi:hypothetical protein